MIIKRDYYLNQLVVLRGKRRFRCAKAGTFSARSLFRTVSCRQ